MEKKIRNKNMASLNTLRIVCEQVFILFCSPAVFLQAFRVSCSVGYISVHGHKVTVKISIAFKSVPHPTMKLFKLLEKNFTSYSELISTHSNVKFTKGTTYSSEFNSVHSVCSFKISDTVHLDIYIIC